MARRRSSTSTALHAHKASASFGSARIVVSAESKRLMDAFDAVCSSVVQRANRQETFFFCTVAGKQLRRLPYFERLSQRHSVVTESLFATAKAHLAAPRLRGYAKRTLPMPVAPIAWTKTCSTWPDTCNTDCIHNNLSTTQQTGTGSPSSSTTAPWKILSGVFGLSHPAHPEPTGRLHRSRRRAVASTVSRQSSCASSRHTLARTIGRRIC